MLLSKYSRCKRAKDAENWAGNYGTRIDGASAWIRLPNSAVPLLPPSGDLPPQNALQIIPAQQLPASLPFVTSFCDGHGRKLFLRGKECGGEWFNLSYQVSDWQKKHSLL